MKDRINEIKNENLYRLGLNVLIAETNFRNEIMSQINKMMNNIGDTEFTFDSEEVASVGLNGSLNNVKGIYQNDHEWIIYSDCEEFPLMSQSTEDLIGIYLMFQNTIETISKNN